MIAGFLLAHAGECFLAALGFGGLLALIAGLQQRSAGARNEVSAIALVAPVGIHLYLVVLALVNAALCSARGVDDGVGATLEVPVCDEYRLATDRLDGAWTLQGVLVKADPSSTHPAAGALEGIESLGTDGGFIFGSFRTPQYRPSHPAMLAGYFLLDAESGEMQLYEDRAALRSATGLRNVTLALSAPRAWYARHRWGPVDVLMLFLSILPPIAAVVLLLRAYRRSMRRSIIDEAGTLSISAALRWIEQA